METGILKHSQGSQYYLIVISSKNYSKLLAIQDYPEIKYYFKNREVSEERLITELDNIGSSEKMYSEEEKELMIKIFHSYWFENNPEHEDNLKEWELSKKLFEQFKK